MGPGRAVRLGTLNLLHGRSLSDGAVVPSRLAEAVRSLRCDVLGLQEVDRGQPRSDGRDLTAEVADAMDAPHARFVPALLGTPGGEWLTATDEHVSGTDGAPAGDGVGQPPAYGVGLVSRLPVESWHVVRLRAAPVRSPVVLPGTRVPWMLADEPRVGLAAVVRTHAGPWTVATTHLSFAPVWNGVQLRWLRDAVADLPRPVVLLGDLNLPAALPRWLTGWRPLAEVKTYPAEDPRVQLDHVLADGTVPPVQSVETPLLALSDHRPVVVELAGP